MIPSIDEFGRLLNALHPADDGFVLQVDDLIRQLPERIAADVYPVVFAFFEVHPNSDCGAPGALVHHVESYYPNYVDALLQSARSSPSYNATTMLNRILNSDIPEPQRNEMLAIFESIAANTAVSDIVRKLASRFLEHQSSEDTQ